MAKHEFGGDWTTDKLERVRKYLCAYTIIFTTNPKAQSFSTIYVDAFAGTGSRIEPGTRPPMRGIFGDPPDKDSESFKKGSARIALEVDPSFNRFIFIEREADRVKELEALRDEFPKKAKDVQIEQDDANAFLENWCRETDWTKHRAVVFLDPYGMQVDWLTVEALAGTQAVDLWLLFPLGVAVNRLLPRKGPPPDEWAKALTRIFGTEEWRQKFYRKKWTKMLFEEDDERMQKAISPRAIGDFFVERLESVFCKVARNPLPLRNSTNSPIYLLCFAAGNPKGAPTAVRIAQHILKP
jgi:three-Cys-motif partner protein